MAASSFSHTTVKAHMKIVDKRRGLATFIPNPDGIIPERLINTSSEFQNQRFKKFEMGEVVIAAFRISPSGKRYLLNVRPTEREPQPEAKHRDPVIDGYFIPPNVQRVFSLADAVAREGGMYTVMLVGPSGYGKTTMSERFAKATGRRWIRVNCAAIRDPEEWFGFREAKDGSTVFEPTEFSEALSKGNTVILLDEVNRLEPWLHNTLLPLLDFGKQTKVHNTHFYVGADTVVCMTINYGVEFAGTFELDQAFQNRVDAWAEVGPPPHAIEAEILRQRVGVDKAVASKIIELAGRIRTMVDKGEVFVDTSTRSALKIAQIRKTGIGLRMAFHDVIEISVIDNEQRKRITDLLNSALGLLEEGDGLNGIPNVFYPE